MIRPDTMRVTQPSARGLRKAASPLLAVCILVACLPMRASSALVLRGGLQSFILSEPRGNPTVRVADGGGHGPETKKTAPAEEETAPEPDAHTPEQPPAEQYCDNVREAAAVARIALQKKELDKAQLAIDERVKLLEEKTREIKSWMKKRDDFLKQANDSLTVIYAKMTPEAAAARLLIMNEMMAAAMLAKLPPKSASAILAEMDSSKAARLSSLLAGAAEMLANKPAQDKPPPKELP